MRYDELQVKASHNSYSPARGLTLAEQLDGDPDDPAAQPCRGLELDMVQNPDAFEWIVAHGGGWDPDERSLRSWLEELAEWSDARPGHDVVTLHLDMKNAPRGTTIAEYAAALDAYVEDALGRDRLYTPGDLVGGAPDLVSAARAGGWPDVSFLRGRIVVCLSGRPARKRNYAEHEPRKRLCFVDRSWARWDRPPPESGSWVFLNVLVTNKKPVWDEIVPFTASTGYVVRGFNIVNPDRFHESAAEGLNVLSTDALRDERFILEPGGD